MCYVFVRLPKHWYYYKPYGWLSTFTNKPKMYLFLKLQVVAKFGFLSRISCTFCLSENDHLSF